MIITAEKFRRLQNIEWEVLRQFSHFLLGILGGSSLGLSREGWDSPKSPESPSHMEGLWKMPKDGDDVDSECSTEERETMGEFLTSQQMPMSCDDQKPWN